MNIPCSSYNRVGISVARHHGRKYYFVRKGVGGQKRKLGTMKGFKRKAVAVLKITLIGKRRKVTTVMVASGRK